jgi:outer membrane protein assembly factor BamA
VATPPGDTEFYKLELRTSWFFKGFGTNHVLEIGGRGGVVSPWGTQPKSPFSNAGFWAACIHCAATDTKPSAPWTNLGEALGGDTYWFASAEYSIPDHQHCPLRLLLRHRQCLSRTVQLQSRAWDVKFFNDDVGMGLRIVLPIGGGTPLRLDYGVPIVHDPNGEQARPVPVRLRLTRARFN